MKITRRQFTCGAALGVAGFAGLRPMEAAARPNVLLILSDDHQARALGAMGNNEIKTPNLDRLASEGTLFTHCFVSNPICTPSRAAILTGQYGFHNGVTFFGHTVQPDSPRWPSLLTDAGYVTAYTGKWHNDGRPSDHGYARMRHVFLGGMNNYDSIPVVQTASDDKQVVTGNPTEVFTDAALELLVGFDDRPWALTVAYTAPHDPRTPPADYEAMYRPDTLSLPKSFMPQPPFDTGTLEIRDELLLPRPLDPEAIQRETGRYYAMITHLDAQIGRILARLEETGQLDNTLIVFAGDNGLTLGAHGLLGKQTLYDEGVRVPMIVRGPGVQRGGKCGALVDLMDIMPTLCEVAGVEPEDIDGRSMLKLARGEAVPRRDAVYLHYDDLFRAVRTEQFKFIAYLKTGREELFNLRDDPYELHDLSEDSAFDELKTELRGKLTAWRQAMGEEGVK